jgi:phage terminase large subunit
MAKQKLNYDDRMRLAFLEAELEKRSQEKPIDILQEALSYQLDFINDPSLRKIVCSERRGGKSFALALALINTCIQTSGAKCVYLSLTNDQCKQVMWTDIFETIFLKYNIQAKLTSKYEIEFNNGSVIFLRGLDATPHQMNRVRGQAFDLAVVDECQDFTQDLKQIIQSVLKMTLAQRAAPLIMAGTPGNKQGLHYWWLINKQDSEETEWQRYKFHWKDNTKIDNKSGLRVCDAIQDMVDKDIARSPNIIDTPEFRQEILGEWVIETSARIYRYEPNINDIETYPTPAFLKQATFVLGFDLGYHPDPTALVIGCYNPHVDGYLYILQAEEHLKMITADLAKRIKELDKEYRFQSIVGDSANLNVISDLNLTYGIPTVKADKMGKLGHQNMLNSDFITNHIRLFRQGTKTLSEQLQTVIWDKHALQQGKHIEDGKYSNHCTDALLYLHFFSRHHWFSPKKPKFINQTNNMRVDEITKTLIKRNKPGQQIDFAEPNKE